jgi:segregation and condensation protein B
MAETEKSGEKKSHTITEETAEQLDNVFDERERENEEKVEAALFISGRFLNMQDLIMLTDINPIMLKEILNRLEKKYLSRAVRIVNRNNSWKMDVAEKYNYMINKLASGAAEFTKAEQETLAVIAYKQPIKQSVIIKIRGNKAYDHIKKFVEIGLVQAKKSGHTNDLLLSEEFYEYFSVQKRGPGEKLVGELENVDEAIEKAEREVAEEEKLGNLSKETENHMSEEKSESVSEEK